MKECEVQLGLVFDIDGQWFEDHILEAINSHSSFTSNHYVPTTSDSL
jgi:hypothetical protein